MHQPVHIEVRFEIQCDAGLFADSEANGGGCSPCAAGYFSPVPGSICLPC